MLLKNKEAKKIYDKKYHATVRKLKQKELIKKGLCILCKRVALPENQLCGYHYSYNRYYAKKWYQKNKKLVIKRTIKRRNKLIQQKMCYNCSKPLDPEMDGDNQMCVNCSIKDNNRKIS